MNAKNERVIVGMSGGVDSSVCAALLKQQGYDVYGLFMRNWDEKDENGACLASKEFADVVKVCEKLQIPYYSIDFVKEYRENVFDKFLQELKSGLTPNPDILCNKEIKFKVFYEKAMELGADYLATGHYCQTKAGKLLKGADPGKDQSYFLHAIDGQVLNKVMFPIGHLLKSDVRKIAEQLDLPVSKKKDSTGICFIGERNFKNFISNYIHYNPGEIRTLDGTIVGRHDGVAYYTIGQRKGLGLGGPGEPWFIVNKDMVTNTLFVERGVNHPALYCHYLMANELTWVSEPLARGKYNLFAKVRYRQEDFPCQVEILSEGSMKVEFSTPQRAVTPGQSIVLYREDSQARICLGGGVITRCGPSLYEFPNDQFQQELNV